MRNYNIILVLLFVFIYLIIKYYSVPNHLDWDFISGVLISVVLSTIIFAAKHEPVKALNHQYIRISTLFIIGFIIVHFQLYLDYVLANNHDTVRNYLINPKIVPKASVISAIGLIAFYIGQMIAIVKNGGFSFYLYSSKVIMKPSSILLYVILVLFVIMLLYANWNYFAGGYGKLDLGEVSTYAQNYLRYSIIGYILLQTRYLKVTMRTIRMIGSYALSFPILFWFVVVTYLGLVLLSGDRGPIIQLFLAFLIGYVWLSNRKIRAIYLGLLMFAASFVITTLGHVRGVDSASSYSEKVSKGLESKSHSSRNNSISPNTFELAVSVRTLHAAVDFVDHKGLSYGVFQGYQTIGIVPGAGLLVQEWTGLNTQSLRSSQFLTGVMGGDHGLGTTAIADVYLDFGLVGVAIIFSLFGAFVYGLERTMFLSYAPPLLVAVLFFTFFTNSIYIGRATILIFFRDAFLTYAIILGAQLIQKMVKK